MNGDNSLFGQMMRHGGGFGYHGSAHEAGTSSVEWAILGLAIAILAIVTLLLLDALLRRRHMRRFRAGQSGHDKSFEILRLRYARGEIAHDEYSQTLADLGTTQGSATTPVERTETIEEEAQPKHRRGRK
jgi:Predicted membrane protein